MGFFSKAKNAALEQAILSVVRPKLERYGELRRFNLDTDSRTFTAEVMLLGETSPITISEGHYRLEKVGAEPYIVLHNIRISREWAQKALEDNLPEIRIKAPDFIRPFI